LQTSFLDTYSFNPQAFHNFTKKLPLPKASSMNQPFSKKRNLIILGIICLLTCFIYSGSLNYPILLNDDIDFFTKYPEILNLSWNNLLTYFSSYHVTLYQPLTVLTFAINYHFNGTNPLPLHLVNLFFHLINILFVFTLIQKLLKQSLPALFTAFIFAVHPMNVEAITWISARSSEMYASFYLLSLISYLEYITSKRRISIVLTLSFFILSLFCKVQAVTLPLILLLIDYYFNRKGTLKLILEKTPFIVLSVLFLVVALRNHETSSFYAHSKLNSYTLFDLVFLNGRSLFFYLQKFLLPLNLSAIYVFPVKSGSWLPAEYYISTLLVLILLGVIYKFRKNKALIFGVGLFLLSLSINLPMISVRSIIFADRYAYFPYLGLLIILTVVIQYFIEKNLPDFRKHYYALLSLILLFGMFLSFETWERNKKWENDLTLTTDIIQQNPPVPLIAKIYRKRGNYYANRQMIKEAIDNYSEAILLDSNNFEAHISRAYTYMKLNKMEEALPDLDKAIELNPEASILHANRAMVKLNSGDKHGALVDCNTCLALDSTNAEAYNLRAVIKFQSGDLHGAQHELMLAIHYNRQYAEAYKNLGIVLLQLGNPNEACKCWTIASRLGDRLANQLLNQNCLPK
jgi:protein O-mannosyl-transferase